MNPSNPTMTNGTEPENQTRSPLIQPARAITEQELQRDNNRMIRARLRNEADLQYAARTWWRHRVRELEPLETPAYLLPNPSGNAPWDECYNRLRVTLERESDVGIVLGLVGRHGCGKTIMATGFILAETYHLRSAKYIKLFGLNLQLEEAMKSSSDTSRREILAELVRPHLLVIDECSASADTEANARCLRHLVDERYGANRDTILISNQDASNFQEFLGEALVDRLNQAAGICSCRWDGFR